MRRTPEQRRQIRNLSTRRRRSQVVRSESTPDQIRESCVSNSASAIFGSEYRFPTSTLHGFPVTNMNTNPITPVPNRNLFPNILSTGPFMTTTRSPLITNPVYVPFCPTLFNTIYSPYPMIPPTINSSLLNPLVNKLPSLVPESSVSPRPVRILSRPDPQPIAPISYCKSDVVSIVHGFSSGHLQGSPTY